MTIYDGPAAAGPQPQGVTCTRRIRLLCLPHAGGGPQVFATWTDLLPSTVEVWPVELPGRGTRWRERPFEDVPSLVTWLLTQFGENLRQPCALFGHSMGALVGFELARELHRSHGAPLVHLFAASHRAPSLPRRGRTLYDLPVPELLSELTVLNGTPRQLLRDTMMMSLLLPALRADLKACEIYSYNPGPPLACPITVLGGTEDKSVTQGELHEWERETTGECTVRMIKGDHFFVKPSAAMVVRIIRSQLSAAGYG